MAQLQHALFDAWKFTDGSGDDWLAIVLQTKSKKGRHAGKYLRDQNGVRYKLSITTTKANTSYFGNPKYLGNVYDDKKLSKRLRIKWLDHSIKQK